MLIMNNLQRLKLDWGTKLTDENLYSLFYSLSKSDIPSIDLRIFTCEK